MDTQKVWSCRAAAHLCSLLRLCRGRLLRDALLAHIAAAVEGAYQVPHVPQHPARTSRSLTATTQGPARWQPFPPAGPAQLGRACTVLGNIMCKQDAQAGPALSVRLRWPFPSIGSNFACCCILVLDRQGPSKRHSACVVLTPGLRPCCCRSSNLPTSVATCEPVLRLDQAAQLSAGYATDWRLRSLHSNYTRAPGQSRGGCQAAQVAYCVWPNVFLVHAAAETFGRLGTFSTLGG